MDLEYIISFALVGAAWGVSLVFLLRHVFGEGITSAKAAFYILSITAVFTGLFVLFDEHHVGYRTAGIMLYILTALILERRSLQRVIMIFSVYIVIVSAAEMVDVALIYKWLEYTPLNCFWTNTVTLYTFTAAAFGLKHVILSLVDSDRLGRDSLILTVLASLAVILATYVQIEFEYTLVLGESLEPDALPLFLAITAVTYLAAAIAAMGFIKSESAARKNMIITEQHKVLEEMYDGTRVFRHNYKNTMIALKGYCDNGEFDKLSERVDELCRGIDYISDMAQFGGALDIADAGLRNLVMLKMLGAQRRGIKTEIAVKGARFGAFESMNMLNAIGALIDNAAESAEKSRGRFIRLSLASCEGGGRLVLSNSIDEKPDMSRIIDKDYSTKSHGGLGLYYVSRVIAKRKDIDIVFGCTDSVFTVCLEPVAGAV